MFNLQVVSISCQLGCCQTPPPPQPIMCKKASENARDGGGEGGLNVKMLKNVFFLLHKFPTTPASPKDMLGYLRTSASQWKKYSTIIHYFTLIEGQYVFSLYFLHFFSFSNKFNEKSARGHISRSARAWTGQLNGKRRCLSVPIKKSENRQSSILRVCMLRNGICCAKQTANRTLEKHPSSMAIHWNPSSPSVLLIHSATQCQVRRLCIRLASWPLAPPTLTLTPTNTTPIPRAGPLNDGYDGAEPSERGNCKSEALKIR